MAKQRGVIKIDGTIDDLTFYKTSDGYLARGRGGVSAERIATDPVFQRTRENGAEFARAGKASKLLRTALRTQLQNAKDKRTASRLTREMMRVIHTDAVNARGQRTVMDGEKLLLQDFNFNEEAQLASILFAPFSASVNRTSGDCIVSLPAFIPVNEIAAPVGATHFLIHAAATAIDFNVETYEVKSAASSIMPLDGTATTLQTLTCTLAAGSALPLFLVLGIEFYQEVNGTNYSLKNGGFNALNIVVVDYV